MLPCSPLTSFILILITESIIGGRTQNGRRHCFLYVFFQIGSLREKRRIEGEEKHWGKFNHWSVKRFSSPATSEWMNPEHEGKFARRITKVHKISTPCRILNFEDFSVFYILAKNKRMLQKDFYIPFSVENQ